MSEPATPTPPPGDDSPVGPCLSVAPPDDDAPVGPCREVLPPPEPPIAPCLSEPPLHPCLSIAPPPRPPVEPPPEPPPSDGSQGARVPRPDAALAAVLARGVLPDDVAARLRARRDGA